MESSSGADLLIVEDSHDDAQFVQRLLVEQQTNVGTHDGDTHVAIETIGHAHTLSDGLEHVTANPPDVILLDLNLPDSRGIDTVERMIAHAPTLPVVVLTGRNDVQTGARAIRRGAQDYLVKGTITGELLLRTLRYAIERAESKRKLRDRNHRLAMLNHLVQTGIRDDVSMIVGRGDQLYEHTNDGGDAVVDSLLEAARHALELTETAAELIDVLSRESAPGTVPVDLTAVLEAEVERVREETDRTLDIERRGRTDSVPVTGSPLLGSVCRQLLMNAAVHTDRERPTIIVTVDATDTEAMLTIADDGVGISDVQKELLTDPRTRLDRGAGMGTGLYLVTTVLEEIGGDLTVEDNTPRGTIVTVTLPRERQARGGTDE
ncbi:ATP-binding response regulator [Natronosalvus vescus]|uniref:ATP-binding response regulator n=1 Tax=Natronosalvus vescus TaxID=2953881 RepID=UPI00209078FF|nr:response regulator [Natronosalvus vescus]